MDSSKLTRQGEVRATHIFQHLESLGWRCARISGSHHIFTRAGHKCLPVALHGAKLSRAVASATLRQAACAESSEFGAATDDDGFSVGDGVELHSLTSAELNGARGTISGPLADGRWPVIVLGRARGVKPMNLRLAVGACPEDEGADGGCVATVEKDQTWTETTAEEATAFARSAADAAEAADAREAQTRALVERAQLFVLAGRFDETITLLAPALPAIEGNDRLPSSHAVDELLRGLSYASVGDLLFFFSVASSERAMTTHAFNSAAQHGDVERALRMLSLVLTRFVHARAEARELLVALQARVYLTYFTGFLDFTVELFKIRMSASSMLGAAAKIMLATTKAKLSGKLTFAQDYDPRDADLDRQNEQLRSGFGFIARLLRSEQLPPLPEDAFVQQQGVLALGAVAQAALIHYERGHVEEACELFAGLLHVIGHSREQLENSMADSTILPSCLSLPTHSSMKMTDKIEAEARACIGMRPALDHALSKFEWRRACGQHSKLSPSIRMEAEKPALNWNDLVRFMELWFQGAEGMVADIHALSDGNMSRFVIESCYDPIRMIEQQVNALLKNHTVLKRAAAVQQQKSKTIRAVMGDVDASEGPWMKQLYRAGLREVRLQLVQMALWLTRLRAIFFEFRVPMQVMLDHADEEKLAVHMRFSVFSFLETRVQLLIESLCCPIHRSTLFDLLQLTVTYAHALDERDYESIAQQFPEVFPKDESLNKLKANFIIGVLEKIPMLLQWFLPHDERQVVRWFWMSLLLYLPSVHREFCF